MVISKNIKLIIGKNFLAATQYENLCYESEDNK